REKAELVLRWQSPVRSGLPTVDPVTISSRSPFLSLFKQLRIDIGLADALTVIPKFNKWLTGLLKSKQKLEEIANIPVSVECSAILLNEFPKKLGDPGRFLIPCSLQDLESVKAHSMTLELANRSVALTAGIAEDVMVKVDKFTFLADFVVVDFEADPRVIPMSPTLLDPSPSPPGDCDIIDADPVFERFTLFDHLKDISDPEMTNTQTPPHATTVVIPTGAPATNTVANHAERPEKFNGQNFKTVEQKHFLLSHTLALRFLGKQDGSERHLYTCSAKANMVEHAGSSSRFNSKGNKKYKRKNDKKSKRKSEYLAPKAGIVKQKFQGTCYNCEQLVPCFLLTMMPKWEEIMSLHIGGNDVVDMFAWVSEMATRHVCADKSMFHSFRAVDNGQKLYMGNFATADIKGETDVF
ncbi:hypothetical protein Tco_1540802, partial [Tanacetum coccineum]